eukprot:2927289-Rhodomonas_salina.2
MVTGPGWHHSVTDEHWHDHDQPEPRRRTGSGLSARADHVQPSVTPPQHPLPALPGPRLRLRRNLKLGPGSSRRIQTRIAGKPAMNRMLREGSV